MSDSSHEYLKMNKYNLMMTHFCYCDNSDLHDTTCKQLMTCWHDTELRMHGRWKHMSPQHFSCVPHSEVHINISYLFPAPL